MSVAHRDEIHELFARRGLRCTSQRRALYESLASSTCHPTADQLFYEVGGRVQGMSLATVYNTLEAFCRAGLAQKIPGKGGSVRYDSSVHNHLHTRCEKTGALHDVPDDLGQRFLAELPKNLLHEVESQLGFRIEYVQVELVGRHVDSV